MHYAMLMGKLPFYADTEEEIINKIRDAPLKFDPEVPLTDMCKEVIRLMLSKDASQRVDLINLIQHDYFCIEDEELEHMVQEAAEKALQ
jgi:serine/threonine protein kinase